MDKNVKLQRRRLISKLESDLESDESSVSQMDPIARFKECTKNLDSESVLTLSDDSDSNHSWYSNNSTIILDSDSQKSESVIRSKRSQRLALEKTKNAPTQSATCEREFIIFYLGVVGTKINVSFYKINKIIIVVYIVSYKSRVQLPLVVKFFTYIIKFNYSTIHILSI